MEAPHLQRILVVEDEVADAHRVAGLLEAEGYRVLTAADGAAGLERALAEKPDLILLDIMMPQLGRLRRLRRTAPPGQPGARSHAHRQGPD